MSLSDEFKQALRSGDLSKAFTMVASKAATLNITTRIVRHPDQGEPYPPDTSLHTQVDLINGTVENDIGEAVLNTPQYQNLQHFHQQQVALGHRKIQENFQGLQQLFQLLVTLQQYDRLMNAEEPLDLKFLEIPNQTLMAATVKVVEPFSETPPPQDDPALPTVAPSAPMEAVSKSQPDAVPEKNDDLADSDSLNFLDNFAEITLDETPEAALRTDDVPGIEAWETPIDTTAVERANGDRPDAYVPNLADFDVDSDPFGDEAIAAQADLDDLELEDLLEDPEPPTTEAVTSLETTDLDAVDDETLFTFLSQDWHNHPGVTEVTSLDGPETNRLPLPPLPENWLEQELAAEEAEALPDLPEAETNVADGEEFLEDLEDLENLDETTADFDEDIFPEDLALGELPEDELGDRLTEPFPDVTTADVDSDPEPSLELTTDDALANDELDNLTASDLERLETLAASDLDDLLGSNEETLIETTDADAAIAPGDTVADNQDLPTDLEDLDAFEFNLFPTDLDENSLGPLNPPDLDSSELALDLDLDDENLDFDPDGFDADFDLEADPLATAETPVEEDVDLLSDFEPDLEPIDHGDSISEDSGLDLDSLEATDALFEENFEQADDFEFDLEPMDLSGEMSLDLDFEQQDFTEDINTAVSPETPDASPEFTTDQDAWLSEMTDPDEEDDDIFNLGELDEAALLDFDLDLDHLSELETEALDDQENSHDFEAREFSKETVIQADFQQPDDLNASDADALSFDDLDLDLDPQTLPPEAMALWDDDLDLTEDLPSLEDDESQGTSHANNHHDATAAPTNDFTDDSWLEELDLSGELDPDFDLGLDGENSAIDIASSGNPDQESAIDLSANDEAIAPLDDLNLDEALADLEELSAFDSKDFDDFDFGDEDPLFLEEKP